MVKVTQLPGRSLRPGRQPWSWELTKPRTCVVLCSQSYTVFEGLALPFPFNRWGILCPRGLCHHSEFQPYQTASASICQRNSVYVFMHICLSLCLYFKGLAHAIMEAGNSKSTRWTNTGWRPKKDPILQSEGHLLAEVPLSWKRSVYTGLSSD